jgi:enoyl-[acyl-carrier-protein] reductase (NADH)
LVLPLDVQNNAEIEAVFARIQQEHSGLDFLVHGVAFANRDDITNPFVQTSREGFRLALDISAYSLIALARGAKPLMELRGGGSILTLTYLGSSRVFPNYNVMGVAKGELDALPGCRSRAAEHSRQRDFRRADQDARCRRHRRFLEHPRRRPGKGAAAAHDRSR